MLSCKISRLLFIVSVLFIDHSTAFADQYDSRKLFGKGAWSVELTHNTVNGNLWCEATTTNKSEQQFGVVAYDNREIALFVIDRSWDIAMRPVRFLVDIDYSRWTIDGTGNGIAVSLTMRDADKAYKFLSELMAGNAVAVMNGDERRLATFSLSGSFAAASKLFECWERIANSDPFTNSSDPFTGVSDPFD